MPTNCLLKTNDVSDTPLLSAVNKVFVFLFCNFLNKIFFSWSAKVVLILFAGIEETLFDRATICAIPIVESGVVGVPATVYSTVVSVLYSIKNLPFYFTSLWSFITTVLDVPVPARTTPLLELNGVVVPDVLVKVAVFETLVVAEVERILRPFNT